MLNEIIATYAITDDLLKAIGHDEDSRRVVSDAEIITTALCAAMFFNGNHSKACTYMKEHGLIPNMLDKSRFNRRLHGIFMLINDLFHQMGMTYGLDVLAFIGWQHENEHQQLIEIQENLNRRGIEINGRNVGKLYRQFLALLGGTIAHTQEKLTATALEHGGLIWAIDALQPEGHGTLLYVLYEVLSGTPVSGILLPQAQAQRLIEWLQPYPVNQKVFIRRAIAKYCAVCSNLKYSIY